MKSFTDLTINDRIYYIEPETTKINSFPVTNITVKGITTDVRNGGSGNFCIQFPLEEKNKTKILLHGYYNISYYFFANEADALEYAKSQAMKELKRLKIEAHKAIDEVLEFRKKYFKELNNDWTREHIDALKARARQKL